MAIQAHLPKRMGWPSPVRSALKRTPVQDFNSFSIIFYYIISTTIYQKIGDLFCLAIFLDFCTVWHGHLIKEDHYQDLSNVKKLEIVNLMEEGACFKDNFEKDMRSTCF